MYYANGVLVENCGDAFCYMIQMAIANGMPLEKPAAGAGRDESHLARRDELARRLAGTQSTEDAEHFDSIGDAESWSEAA